MTKPFFSKLSMIYPVIYFSCLSASGFRIMIALIVNKIDFYGNLINLLFAFVCFYLWSLLLLRYIKFYDDQIIIINLAKLKNKVEIVSWGNVEEIVLEYSGGYRSSPKLKLFYKGGNGKQKLCTILMDSTKKFQFLHEKLQKLNIKNKFSFPNK